MLSVAFGVENGIEYVLMKNSYGASWGEAGYIKVALIPGNIGVCGLYHYVLITLV
jgi:hypothetical protein